MRKHGFSAIEILISMALSSVILMAAAEFFGLTRNLFLKLKAAEEENQSAVAALDKMKIDILRAGAGLVEIVRVGTINAIVDANNTFVVYRLDQAYALGGDLSVGDGQAVLKSVSGLNPGQEVCFADDENSEVGIISSLSGKTIVLSSPLKFSYLKDSGRLLALEKTSLFYDSGTQLIRRKVNTSSPQPLLEDVRSFDCSYDKNSNLARLSFTLNHGQEKKYEILVFPKNIGLSLPGF
jgi:prepilin-type N-terminal cleavage/methylation domain-containing protein